jgi:hypothetical protein
MARVLSHRWVYVTVSTECSRPPMTKIPAGNTITVDASFWSNPGHSRDSRSAP